MNCPFSSVVKRAISLLFWYGKNNWALSTYSSNVGTIKNYISPFLGSMKLKDITPRVLEKHYQRLLKTKPVVNALIRITDG